MTASSSNNKTKEKESRLRPDTIIITGVARLPDNMSNNHLSNIITIEAEVDPINFKVVDLACSFPSHLLHKILCHAMINETIENGLQQTIMEIENRFFSITQRATIAALEDIYKNWHRYLKTKEK